MVELLHGRLDLGLVGLEVDYLRFVPLEKVGVANEVHDVHSALELDRWLPWSSGLWFLVGSEDVPSCGLAN